MGRLKQEKTMKNRGKKIPTIGHLQESTLPSGRSLGLRRWHNSKEGAIYRVQVFKKNTQETLVSFQIHENRVEVMLEAIHGLQKILEQNDA